jgi:hypothetical protein
MGFDKCANCGEYAWTSNHKCKPLWYVFRDEDEIYSDLKYDLSSRHYRATDAEEAAISFCESNWEMPDELELLVMSAYDYENMVFDYQSNPEEIDKNVDVILESCIKFSMESEIVRNFYATKTS